MAKLCLVYNFAQRYRESIFRAIDKRWDCKWYFGRNTTDIKGMDYSLLKEVHEVENETIKGPWFYQKGTSGLVFDKSISSYFLLGDPHCISVWFIAAWVKFFCKKKNVYMWTHGWYGKESRMTSFIKKRFFKLADGVFLYGNYARKLMINKGFNADKLFVIHNSLHHDKQVELRAEMKTSGIYQKKFKNSYPTIIFIGRLTKVKKLHQLIEAIAQLKKTGKFFNVVFVGDGTERKFLEQKTQELELEENTWFYGACYDEQQNASLIYEADLCVAPGNVGLTAMHTMVFGTPVITHSNLKNQMPEFEAIKDGETGSFFEEDDVTDLARSISEWFEIHGKDRDTVRKACYEEIDNYWTPEFQMQVLEQNLKV